MPKNSEVIPTAIRLLLRPVLRLCVRNSIKLQEILEMVKLVLVDVAKEDLERNGEAVSASKLSVVTGVHRKDVTRLERSGGEYKRPDNQIAKIMTQWQCDERFITKAGKPRVLHCEGRDSEFAELVGSVNGKDLSSYSVLFEMERLGMVERKGNSLKLKGRDYIHGDDVEAGLKVLAADANDLIAAVEENLFEEKNEKNLHLRTEFDRIPLTKLEEAKRWLLEEGSQFHKRARQYLSRLDLDLTPTEDSNQPVPCGRIAVGTFGVSEELTTQKESR
ncbi:MAG: hypothetical protein KDD70_03335 [Bdellovibrionales bacterium]|nr:hypothetical protein [Bdellovibrionales bacterium]